MILRRGDPHLFARLDDHGARAGRQHERLEAAGLGREAQAALGFDELHLEKAAIHLAHDADPQLGIERMHDLRTDAPHGRRV